MPVLFSFLVLSSSLLGASSAGLATGEPVAIVRSFHDALSSGNREAALAVLDPGVLIFEQGGAEMSRDEYASEHLGADIEFSRSTSSKVVEQRIQGAGKGAWVLTISETAGTFRGKNVSSRNVETMVLERKSGGWRIVHIHWSSHHEDGGKS
jgi:ketosteroid isomerase-like protein